MYCASVSVADIFISAKTTGSLPKANRWQEACPHVAMVCTALAGQPVRTQRHATDCRSMARPDGAHGVPYASSAELLSLSSPAGLEGPGCNTIINQCLLAHI